jgi:hypothetical protein
MFRQSRNRSLAILPLLKVATLGSSCAAPHADLLQSLSAARPSPFMILQDYQEQKYDNHKPIKKPLD